MKQYRFRYSPAQLAKLERTLSADRLSTYLAIANGDRKRAIKLYERNTALSESLYGPLQALEVALRNAMHETLSEAFGRVDWYDAPICPLRHPQTELVLKAKRTLTRDGKSHDPGRVIAELNFGFWVGLTGRRYDGSLWIPHLHKAFSEERLGRKAVQSTLEPLRKLRNRIAHHEPILVRDLASDFLMINQALGWICLDTAAWMRRTSNFQHRCGKGFLSRLSEARWVLTH